MPSAERAGNYCNMYLHFPQESIRRQIAKIIGEDRFRLIYMAAGLEESRKNKPELYKLSEEGKIQHLAGVDIPYEAPEDPDLVLEAGNKNIEKIIELLQSSDQNKP
ncbi:MAG: adenylyl-sulfate kinase [Candidatus Marinimicrobia bacterium]|nr:adenylyl-sulfate kinase [Candidatus Neomarinimicrobiota bacterium]